MTHEFIPNAELREYQVFPVEGGKIGFRNPQTDETFVLAPSDALDLYIRSHTDPDSGKILIDKGQAISILLVSRFSTITTRGLNPDNPSFYEEYPKVQPRLNALAEIGASETDAALDFNEVLEKHMVAFK